MKQKSKLLLIYNIILFLFTGFVLLYEFVIPHGGYVIDDPEIVIEAPSEELIYPGTIPSTLQSGTVIGTYTSDYMIITIYQIRAYSSNVYVADVVVSDAQLILSALAYNSFGGSNVTQTVSEMATDHDAIFAINADYASHYNEGFVIKNGKILRSSTSSRDAAVLYKDGSFNSLTESDSNINDILDDGAWQLWSFGPVLIKNGVSVASVNDGLQRSAANNPRSAIGYVDTNHFMFVTVDGRSTSSTGVDIEELADIMASLNCTEAYNFDGGGSATMWFDNEVVNNPSEGDERGVGDCVYISKA